jgi:hypothetical protein
MNSLDKLRQAWQSQCHKPLEINPDLLLKTARFERLGTLFADMFVILLLLSAGIWMMSRIRDIHEDWPWLIYCAFIVWVVGFMLFNQLRRRRHAPHYEEPLLAHVEFAIKGIEYRMWQDRQMFWWYTLPIALGCMIPSTMVLGMAFHREGDWGSLEGVVVGITMLLTIGFFAAVFAFVQWSINR